MANASSFKILSNISADDTAMGFSIAIRDSRGAGQDANEAKVLQFKIKYDNIVKLILVHVFWAQTKPNVICLVSI